LDYQEAKGGISQNSSSQSHPEQAKGNREAKERILAKVVISSTISDHMFLRKTIFYALVFSYSVVAKVNMN